MKRFLTMGFLVTMAGPMLAGVNGGSVGAFLTLPAGARSAALGEGGMALAVDASALHLNPASMAGLKTAGVVGTHAAYIDDSFYDHLTYVNPTSKRGAWGVGVQYFNAGSLDETDGSGNAVGSFSPSDLALTVGYARRVGPVSAGAGVKYIRSKLVDTASAVSLDAGLESKWMMGNRLKLGVVGQNLIGSLKYDQESNDLPRAIKAGAAYRLKKRWDIVADAAFPKDEDSYFSLGTEYRLKVKAPWRVALRGGYNTRTTDVDGFTGFSLGMGVRHDALSVDYAYLPFGDFGSTHWITLGWRI